VLQRAAKCFTMASNKHAQQFAFMSNSSISQIACSANTQSVHVFDCHLLMFAVSVDAKQGDRATAMHWRSFKRPHMRIFYVSTFSYFTAFLAWFAFAPLLPEVRISGVNLQPLC
jgi:hypothetical protein